MRKYSEYPYASISMSKERKFIDSLTSLFKNNKLTHVFESGTFTGMGSTTTLAETIISTQTKIERFITLEADPTFYKEAKRNLSKYSFVTPVNGLSVHRKEAMDFVKNDEAVIHHERYPDVFIDDVEDPVKFYYDEISGNLSSKTGRGLLKSLYSKLASTGTKFVDGAFEQFLPEFKGKDPLILLDSAGGIGYLEYQKVMQILSGDDFFLILDDIHHLKHFRSRQDIEKNPRFSILDINIEHGWLIARYKK